jgi:hypothetical protein
MHGEFCKAGPRPSQAQSALPIGEACPVRLLLLADATDDDGRPRVALALPAEPNGHRPPLLLFPNMTAALAAKRQAEAAEAGR